MSLIFSAADMLPKIRLFEYQEESMKGETIAAISTAVSSSGIGIVRISGDQAFEIADRVYRSPKGKKKLSEQQSHTVHYGYICDGDEVLDEVGEVFQDDRTDPAQQPDQHGGKQDQPPKRHVPVTPHAEAAEGFPGRSEDPSEVCGAQPGALPKGTFACHLAGDRRIMENRPLSVAAAGATNGL